MPAPVHADVPLPAEETPVADPVGIAHHITTTAGDAFGDEAVLGSGLRILLQTRYTMTQGHSGIAAENDLTRADDGWALNRAFLRAVTHPVNWLSAKMLLDFGALRLGDAVNTVKLAYVEIEPVSRVKIVAGLFKRAYSLLELLPIAEYEFADTGLADTLIKDTGFGGRDFGAMVTVAPLPKKKWLRLSLGAYQGGHIGTDGRVDGLLTLRAESSPTKHLHLGANAAWRREPTRNGLDTADGEQKAGWAWGADMMLQYPSWEVRAEVLGGDRTDVKFLNNPELGADAETFLSAWGLFVYRIPVRKMVAMPGVRFEYLDTDRQHPVGTHWLVSGALNWDFDARVRLLLDVTQHWASSGTLPFSQRPTGYASGGSWQWIHDANDTRFVLQLQVRL